MIRSTGPATSSLSSTHLITRSSTRHCAVLHHYGFDWCASRKFIRYALRADFEQIFRLSPIGLALRAAPPSLREGTPPDSGGDWAKPGLDRIH